MIRSKTSLGSDPKSNFTSFHLGQLVCTGSVSEAGAAGSAPAGKVCVAVGALLLVRQVLQVQHLLGKLVFILFFN